MRERERERERREREEREREREREREKLDNVSGVCKSFNFRSSILFSAEC